MNATTAADPDFTLVDALANEAGRRGPHVRALLLERLHSDERRERETEAAVIGMVGLGKGAECAQESTGRGYGSSTPREITLENFEELMRFRKWHRGQSEAGDQVREALTLAGRTILRVCPPGDFRDRAVRRIIDARMNANAAISFFGQF